MRVRKFMDVLTMEQLGDFVTRPAVKGGGPEMVTAQKSEALEKYMREDLLPRLQASKAWKPSKDEPFNPDPVIAIGTDGRLAAIDARFADKSLKDDPGSKLNLMIDDIIAEITRTKPVRSHFTFTQGLQADGAIAAIAAARVAAHRRIQLNGD